MKPSSLARSRKVTRPVNLLLVAALLALAGCSRQPAVPTFTFTTVEPGGAPAASPETPAAPTQALAEATSTLEQLPETGSGVTPAPAQGQTFTVEIVDNTFNPAELTVPAGSTVIWTHNGQRPHTVTADDGSFDSGELNNGATFQHTFDQAGEFAYHCDFHGGAGGEGMGGIIIVEAAPAVDLPGTEPAASGSATRPGISAPAFTILGTVNRDTTQAAQSPFLAVGSTAAGASANLWASWAENSPGGVRQIFASELAAGSFQARGASVNIHVNVIGDSPAITFAGENRLVPWVAWVEPSPGLGNVPQVFASRFNPASGLWQQAGQDRGGGEASLNLHTSRPAAHPFIFAGSGDPAQPPVPWVAWEELSGNSVFPQIFVARGVKVEAEDPAIIGGLRWEPVGENRANNEPTLNVDPLRHALHPTAVFAETGNSVPWVTWHETGKDRPSRIFTARGVADANVPGGFKWITVPACNPDETACALNVNPLKDAKDAAMAAGTLTPGEAAVPWIAWAEIGPTGKWQIFVSRLDTNTRNSFLPVGGSLNVDQNHDARTPFITFAGSVPYVAWLEDDGTGKLDVQVRHLASDPQTGTWVLDTPPAGFNFDPALSDSGLFAVGSDQALFMAWVEGDPAAEAAQVVIGQLLVNTKEE